MITFQATDLLCILPEIILAGFGILVMVLEPFVPAARKRLLGAAYGRASDVRAWLRDQPQKSLILAYLSDLKPEAR